MSNLDTRVAELAAKYQPIAIELLKEAIRIPADHVDRPVEAGGDPQCGTSNHEQPRLEYLKRRIVEIGAVRRAEDVCLDDFGNLVWFVEDPSDGIEPAKKKVVYIDGHTDTVRPLRPQWREKAGLDPFDGMTDPAKVNKAFLKKELGWVPPESEWQHLIFGRGSADQLGGVVSAIVATKILLELAPEGALRGRDRPLLRHGVRGGQRRRRARVPQPQGVPHRPAGDHPRRRHPHRRHRLLPQRRPRHLPRPARAHADRGHGHRPLLPRLHAQGGPQPAGVRRRHPQGGRRAARARRGLPHRPVPRPRHPHRLLVAPRHPQRLRRARALRVPLRPAPHHRRDPGGGGGRRGGPGLGGGRPQGRPHGGGERARSTPTPAGRASSSTTLRSTWAG